jgi:hypothetical protein
MKAKNTLQSLPKWQLLLLLFFLGLFSGQAQQLQSMLLEDWENNDWRNVQVTEYAYDPNGFLAQSLFSVWYSPPDDFVLQGRMTNVNNAAGLPLETINDGWDYQTGGWSVSTHWQNTYTDFGAPLIKEFDFWENGIWNPVTREVYEYNSDNKKTIITAKLWEVGFNYWKDLMHYLYTYNEQGLVSLKVTEQWNDVDNIWFSLGEESYTYDANGNLILSQVGDVSTEGGRSLYTYNTSNALLQEIRQVSNNGVWENAYQKLYSYNLDGTLSQEIEQYWINATWINHERITYNYTALGVPHFNERQLVVYPNPSSDHITISGGIEGTAYSIWDTMGRLVTSGKMHETDERINVEQLAAGTYLMTAGGGTCKIIKQ